MTSAAWLRHWLYDWGGLNSQLMLWINQSSTLHAILVAKMLSAIGSYWGAPLVALALFWWRRLVRSPAVAAAPVRFVAAFVVAMLVVAVAKAGFGFPRPADVLGHEMMWLAAAPDSLHAFPSGHSTYTGVVVASLWSLVRVRWRVVLAVLALAIGWSRIALGAHFPADVMAGLLLGVACVAAMRPVSRAAASLPALR